MYYRRDWLIFFVVIILIFLAAARTAIDADMWWHLRAGQESVTQGFPLVIDKLSFTHANQPWTNHSWLSQVIFFLVYQLAGFTGLGALVAFCAAASMGLLFFQMPGKPIFRAFILVLGTLVAAVAWSPRPQMISWVLLAGLSLILFLYRSKEIDFLWWLPVLFLLWSNLHGGYTFGLILLGVTIAGEVLNKLLKIDLYMPLTWREIGRIILIAIICGLAVVINPNGIKMWLIPFETLDSSVKFISEWASPDFHELYQQPLLWLLLATIAAFGLSGRRADAAELLSVIVFSGMALSSRRFYGPFALIATPILARYFWYAWRFYRHGNESDLFSNIGLQGRFIPLWKKVINLSLVGLLFLVGCIKAYLVNHPVFIDQTVQQSLPAGAVNWIREYQPKGQMLNEYNWGGYLSWALQEHPVFIDGRADLYGDLGINEWMAVVEGGEFSQAILDGYGIGFVLLEPQKPLVKVLDGKGWNKVFVDQISVVLVRPGSASGR